MVAVSGAARGIGLAAARRLEAGGAVIAGIDRDRDTLEQAMLGELAAGGSEALALAADVGERGDVDRVFAQIDSRFGRLDALVNCAGITGRTGMPAHEVDPDDFERVHRINVHAADAAHTAAVLEMLRRGYGRVSHVASIAGKEGNADMPAYSATKAGLIGLVKAHRQGLCRDRHHHQRAGARRYPHAHGGGPADTQVQYMTDKIPMKRCCKLEEAAGDHRIHHLARVRLHHRLHLRPVRRKSDLLIGLSSPAAAAVGSSEHPRLGSDPRAKRSRDTAIMPYLCYTTRTTRVLRQRCAKGWTGGALCLYRRHAVTGRGCVAQLVEQLNLNQRVHSSILCTPTRFLVYNQADKKAVQIGRRSA